MGRCFGAGEVWVGRFCIRSCRRSCGGRRHATRWESPPPVEPSAHVSRQIQRFEQRPAPGTQLSGWEGKSCTTVHGLLLGLQQVETRLLRMVRSGRLAHRQALRKGRAEHETGPMDPGLRRSLLDSQDTGDRALDGTAEKVTPGGRARPTACGEGVSANIDGRPEIVNGMSCVSSLEHGTNAMLQ